MNIHYAGKIAMGAALAFFSSTCFAADDEVVLRCGFESCEDMSGWVSKGRFSFSDGEGENGSRALVWDGATSIDGGESFTTPTFPVETGCQYRFRIKARSDADIVGRVYMYIRYFTDNGVVTFEGRPIVNNSWKKGRKWTEIFGGTTMVPPGAKKGSVSVGIRTRTTGRMVFDNLEVMASPKRVIRFVQSSAYRNCATDGEVRFLATYVLENSSNLPRMGFTVRGKDGSERRLLANESSNDWFSVTCDVKDIAKGEHPVVAWVEDSGGKVLDRRVMNFNHAETLPPRKVYFDAHHRLMVDGKPFFPLAMDGCGGNDAETDIYADSPLNATVTGNFAAFDRAEKRGLKVIFGFGVDRMVGRGEDQMREMCGKIAMRPGFLAWYNNDEQPPGLADMHTELYQRLCEYDPDHPVYAVLDKHWHVRDFMPSFDCIAMDPYPVGNRNRGPIGICTEWGLKASEAVFGMRPLWQEPQAFDWEWHRRNFNASSKEHHFPTRDEFRSMAWQPIAIGAKGLIWYSFDWLLKESSPAEFRERWGYVRETIGEIARFAPVFLSVEPAPVAKSSNPSVTVRTWRQGGSVYLVAVNTTDSEQVATVMLKDFSCKSQAKVEVGSAPIVEGESYRFALPPLGVSFVRWSSPCE